VLAGDATLGARAPHEIDAKLDFQGDGDYRGGHAAIAATGEVARLEVTAKGGFREAAIAARALVTPFAAAPLVSADVDASDVDLAQFKSGLPTTALTLKLAARPTAQGFAGTVDARNDAVGAIDADRVPVAALSARYAWEGQVLELEEIVADLAGNGRATGSGRLPLDGGPSQWDLRLSNVNLARLQSSLIATHLSGTIAAEVAEARQVVRADLRQEDMALSFAATVEGTEIVVQRFRAQAGEGVLAGSASASLDANRRFKADVRATAFDPGRFADVPHGRLDGTLTASGTLAPGFDVTAALVLARGSRYAERPLYGTARAHVVTPGTDLARATARDVSIDLHFGTARLVLSGAFGAAADRLTYDVDIPRVADWRELVTRYGKVTLPEPVLGSVHARGTVSGDPRSPGFTVDAQGKDLQWGPDLRAQSITANGSIAAGFDARGRVALDARTLKATVAAKDFRTPALPVRTLRFQADGTLARHAATLAATAEGIDLDVAVTGSVRQTPGAGASTESAWSGTLDKLINRGDIPVRLEAPATLEVAPGRVRVGNARVAIADGRAHLATFALDDEKLATQGTFTGIPVASLARLAGQTLPLRSTLVIGGDWSLTAAPRLNGSFNVAREKGDLYATDDANVEAEQLAFGISALSLATTWKEDALSATATMRGTRAGTASATASLAAGQAPRQFATDVPFTATLVADLPSLKPLQPFLGTLAVLDGRARLDVKAEGTLAQPVLAGTMTGEALRLDLPQYGVHLKDGRLRARLAERAIVLDEFSFGGGKGRFNAKGTLARASNAADRANATAEVTWDATDFTLVNRPDLRIVADGKGTLALEGGKLALKGEVRIDEGRVVYAPVTDGTLSADVVIVGQPRTTKKDDDATRDLPLNLDLEVALGRDFRFTGEGLDTRLAGRVRITTTPAGTLAGKGSIRAVSGTYYVFGQRLDITRGRLIFDGPVDNPGLDIVALRRNLAVEAGVEVSGTVRVPRVRLVSDPPVPDGEKLAWLITGQGLDRANSADFAALAAASASLLGQGKKPITTQIANTFGLDDITFRGSSSSTSSSGGGQVVAFGKRISDRMTLVYEQGLDVASNALRLEYALSRTLTLRAEAGTVSSLGFFFRRSFD
jgi:translocation and assembly module TamB